MKEDYLIHYGVLGMKWGVRRAAKKGTTYSYKSMGTKRLEKKASKLSSKAANAKSQTKKAKLSAKASKVSSKAKASAKSDKDLLNYAKKTSVKKALAQKIAFQWGAKSYNRMRASGVSRGKAAATQIIANVGAMTVSAITGGAASKVVGKVGSKTLTKMATKVVGTAGAAEYLSISRAPGNKTKKKTKN